MWSAFIKGLYSSYSTVQLPGRWSNINILNLLGQILSLLISENKLFLLTKITLSSLLFEYDLRFLVFWSEGSDQRLYEDDYTSTKNTSQLPLSYFWPDWLELNIVGQLCVSAFWRKITHPIYLQNLTIDNAEKSTCKFAEKVYAHIRRNAFFNNIYCEISNIVSSLRRSCLSIVQ